MWVMDQCTETRGGTPALVGLSEVIITPAAEFWEDYRQLRSSGVRSSRRLCTSCVQEGGFEGPEIGSMQRRINNRLLSYRPAHCGNNSPALAYNQYAGNSAPSAFLLCVPCTTPLLFSASRLRSQ